MNSMSQLPKKQPVGQPTKPATLMSSILFVISLILIFSPFLVYFALTKLVSSSAGLDIIIISLVPFIIGVILLVILRQKKIV